MKKLVWPSLIKIIIKMQNIWNLLCWKSVHISDVIITTVQISVECGTQESEAGYTKHLNL